MNENRGEILNTVLHEYSVRTGITLTKIANKAGYDQSTMYRHFKDPALKSGVLWRYGNAIEYDFRQDIVELDKELSYLSEPEVEYGAKPRLANNYLNELVAERDSWRNKYIELLEKHNALMLEKVSVKS